MKQQGSPTANARRVLIMEKWNERIAEEEKEVEATKRR